MGRAWRAAATTAVCLSAIGAVRAGGPAGAADEPAGPDPPAATGQPAFTRPVAQQVEGLRQEASTTYEVDAAAVVTRVTVEATITHVRPDDAEGYWYYDTYSIAVPAEASALSVTIDDAPATFDRAPVAGSGGSSDEVTVTFSPVLRYGQSRRLVYRYELGPQEERDDVWSQANEAAFMFPVSTRGDPGASDVTVRVPERYDVEVVGAELDEERSEDGHTVLSSRGIGAPGTFRALVIATDRSRLLTVEEETAAGDIVVRAWPGHEGWVEFVTRQVDEGVPVLAELIGLEWPENDRPLVVEETLEPIAAGFGGEYNSDDHTVRIPDTQESHRVLHEVAHVWVNLRLFSERWLAEGFAEHLADEAREALGEPTEYQRPTADELPADPPLALSSWTTPAINEEADRDIQDYAYPASWYVIGTVAEEIGPDATREVLVSASDRDMTYVGADDPGQMAAPVTWHQVLDLFENIGGSERAADLFATYVAGPGGQAELDERAEARADYEQLAERGGTWAPPYEVRQAMATWDFDRAMETMPEAHGVLDVRDELDVQLAEVDNLAVDDLGVAEQYDDAREVTDALSLAERTSEAVEAYDNARDQRPGGPWATLGLIGQGADGNLDRAREALVAGEPREALLLSEAAEEEFEGATLMGLRRLAAVVLAVALVAVLVHRRRAHRRRPGLPADHRFPG